jgi:hypothetical protein
MELTAIALNQPIEAIHPDTGEKIMIVGVELSRDPVPTMLVALRHSHDGLWPERLEFAKHAGSEPSKASVKAA